MAAWRRATQALTLAAAAGVTTGLLAAGCTPEFENPTTVRDLRLLAVAADPTEVLVDLAALQGQNADAAAVDALLPRYQLRALVLDPAGAGRAISYRTEACGNDPLEGNADPTGRPGRVGATVAQAPCPSGSTLVAEGTAVPDPDGRLILEVMFAPTREFITSAVMTDPLGIELGLPLKLSFVVQAGDQEVVVVKRVLLSPRLSAEQTPNANPDIPMLLWRKDRLGDPQPLDSAQPMPVAPGSELRISPAPGDAEPYQTRSFSRQQRQFVTETIAAETLRYAFFATGGTFSPGNATTDTNPLRTGQKVDLESVWTAPTQPGQLVDLYVIVRDERTGTGWARARLQVQPVPAGP